MFQFFCGDGRGSFRPAQVQVQTRPKALTAQPHPPPHPSSAPRSMLPQQRPAESAERTRRSPSRSSSPCRARTASPPPRATQDHTFPSRMRQAPQRGGPPAPFATSTASLWPQVPHRPWPVRPRPELRPPRYAGPTCRSPVLTRLRRMSSSMSQTCAGLHIQTSRQVADLQPKGHFTMSKAKLQSSLPKAARQPSHLQTKLSSP